MALVLERYPITYRKEIVRTLMQKSQRSESACLVGLAGVGKSNLMTFLAQEEVRQRYLPENWQHTHFLGVVCKAGTQEPDVIFKAILDEALSLIEKIEPGTSLDSTPGQSLLQTLRNALNFLCLTHQHRVIFVLDEFEEAIRNQPFELFDSLRSLRDDHRTTGAVQFVVITHRLPQLIFGQPPFHTSRLYSILRDNIYPLPPYSTEDAEWMLHDLCRKKDRADLSPLAVRELLANSGGHGELLRAIFEDLEPDFDVANQRLSGLVEKASRTRTSCQRIWTHLHYDEQAALRKLSVGRIVVPEWAVYLHRRGLITTEAPDGLIFSPVFGRYIQLHHLS